MESLINIAVNYWVQALFAAMATGLAALFRWLVNRFRENDNRQDSVEKGIQALLRDRIVQSYTHYTEKGYIPLHCLESVDRMYAEYHNLGGNGTVTKLYNDIRKLEVHRE